MGAIEISPFLKFLLLLHNASPSYITQSLIPRTGYIIRLFIPRTRRVTYLFIPRTRHVTHVFLSDDDYVTHVCISRISHVFISRTDCIYITHVSISRTCHIRQSLYLKDPLICFDSDDDLPLWWEGNVCSRWSKCYVLDIGQQARCISTILLQVLRWYPFFTDTACLACLLPLR